MTVFRQLNAKDPAVTYCLTDISYLTTKEYLGKAMLRIKSGKNTNVDFELFAMRNSSLPILLAATINCNALFLHHVLTRSVIQCLNNIMICLCTVRPELSHFLLDIASTLWNVTLQRWRCTRARKDAGSGDGGRQGPWRPGLMCVKIFHRRRDGLGDVQVTHHEHVI